MRVSITKKHFTRAERRFCEFLKKYHIPFETKVKINGREVDFLVGRYAIDIDCHEQDGLKNHMLADCGYIPIHFTNQEVKNKIKKLKWV